MSGGIVVVYKLKNPVWRFPLFLELSSTTLWGGALRESGCRVGSISFKGRSAGPCVMSSRSAGWSPTVADTLAQMGLSGH
jgi:hypothetical protein